MYSAVWEDITYWRRELFITSMATSFGKFKEFDSSSGEDWIQYVERMEFYFAANGVTYASKQHANWCTGIQSLAEPDIAMYPNREIFQGIGRGNDETFLLSSI